MLKGQKLVDFKNSNLHVLNYSIPVHKKVTLAELKQHLFTLPAQPDLIPYRTSYYNENWGFCLSHNQYLSLADGGVRSIYRFFPGGWPSHIWGIFY
jgi:aminopeptidase-like protein